MTQRPALNRRRFLLSSVGLGLGAGAGALAAQSPAALGLDYGADASVFAASEFRNWTGNIRSRPAAMLRPANLSSLQQAVAAAVKVKAVGSGHSFSPCAHTAQTMIQTDDLDRILAVDLHARRVKVEGGKKLCDLNDELAELGLAIPSLGDIAVQSVAGAISTGTHGTGLAWGSLADAGLVQGLELVLADGTLLALDADRPADRPALEAARLGLGALGIVYSVTLNLAPAHNLERTSRLMPLAEALDPRLYRDHDHFEFFRFPFTDLVQGVTRDLTAQPAKPHAIRAFVDKMIMENAALGTILNLASLRPSSVPRAMALIADLVPTEYQVDRSDRMMTSKRLVRAFEIEYAIPITQAAAMQQRFSELVVDFAKRPAGRFYANFPCECRFVRGDVGNLLSPTQGADSCWFSVASHVAFPGYEPFFREIEAELLAIGGRPHWGKLFYKSPVSLYPKFDEFVRWREHFDPKGKFSNVFVDRLLAGKEIPTTVS